MTCIHFQINPDNTYLSDWKDGRKAVFIDGSVNPFTYNVDAIDLDTDNHIDFTINEWTLKELKDEIHSYNI